VYPVENAPDRYELAEVDDLVSQLGSRISDIEEWTPEVLLPRRRDLQVACALLDRAVECTEQMLAQPADD
jgi:hypothetical protein